MNKKVKNVLRYVMSVILAFFITALVIVNVSKATILDKNYILNKLDKTGYYVKIFDFVKDNFKNHIQQSGLDESILDNLITQEKVEADTKIIITNMYNNVHEEISIEDIREKLNKSIEEQTRGMLITTEQKQDINKFIDDICNEYLLGIAHFNTEKEIYSVFDKAKNIIEILNKVSLVGIAITAVLLMTICMNRPYKFFVFTGISLFASGLFFTIVNIYINIKINVQAITILNDAFSFTLREVIETILNQINQKGILFLCVGFAFILIPTTIHTYIKNKKYEQN